MDGHAGAHLTMMQCRCWHRAHIIRHPGSKALNRGRACRFWHKGHVFGFCRRFWHKVLYDIGVVSTREPFQRLVSQGMILGEVRPSHAESWFAVCQHVTGASASSQPEHGPGRGPCHAETWIAVCQHVIYRCISV